MDAKKTVLIVEDEKNIVDIVRFNLQKEGYATLEAYDGEAGLAIAREKKPDLILLDVMMPKMMGFDVCRILREEGDNVPVIMLTAREEEADKVLGLELGADDYITKPFSMRELMARVKANIRRTAMTAPAAADTPVLTEKTGIFVNAECHQVYKNGVAVELTQREYELLSFLVASPERVFSREDLMKQVWNYDYIGDDLRAVDVTVRRLREKVEDDAANPAYILTRRGVGYYYAPAR
ncbi:MAG: response regulator transcription factor [Oscillospiraceae bacterium]|nr:response regulator transcription factor [Oscillospiraceae bacterium]